MPCSWIQPPLESERKLRTRKLISFSYGLFLEFLSRRLIHQCSLEVNHTEHTRLRYLHSPNHLSHLQSHFMDKRFGYSEGEARAMISPSLDDKRS